MDDIIEILACGVFYLFSRNRGLMEQDSQLIWKQNKIIFPCILHETKLTVLYHRVLFPIKMIGTQNQVNKASTCTLYIPCLHLFSRKLGIWTAFTSTYRLTWSTQPFCFIGIIGTHAVINCWGFICCLWLVMINLKEKYDLSFMIPLTTEQVFSSHGMAASFKQAIKTFLFVYEVSWCFRNYRN